MPTDPFSPDSSDQPDPSGGSDRSDGSDRSSPSDPSDRSERPGSPPNSHRFFPHDYFSPDAPIPPKPPSLSDLGKPPPEDPLQWNPRLREVLDLIRGLSSSDLQHALVSMGFVREEDVLQALAMECEMERVDWNTVKVTPDLLAQIPSDLAWRYHVFPVRYDETTLWVALDNPLDPRILLDLEEELGRPVRGAIASEGEILRMLGMHYD
jgi:hypothetical protein